MNMTLTDENGKKWELVSINRHRPDQDEAVIRRIPTPPAKETYDLMFWSNESGDSPIDTHLDLTPPQAEALAKAIEALLAYVQDEQPMPVTMDIAYAAKAAIQDGSAA